MTPYLDLRQEVYSPFEASGYEGNVWATWIRDLLCGLGPAAPSRWCCGDFTAGAHPAPSQGAATPALEVAM